MLSYYNLNINNIPDKIMIIKFSTNYKTFAKFDVSEFFW